MSFAGRLARGLAAGLGKYLTQEGLARLDGERLARILKDRAQARSASLHGVDEDEAAADPYALDARTARGIGRRINRSTRLNPLIRGQ